MKESIDVRVPLEIQKMFKLYISVLVQIKINKIITRKKNSHFNLAVYIGSLYRYYNIISLTTIKIKICK